MKKKGRLKLFKSIGKITLPYVITTTATVVTVKLFGGGLPFVRDDITKYKYYTLKGSNSSIVDIHESYQDSNDSQRKYDNTITTYSTWQNDNNKYYRIIRKYTFDNISDKKILDAFYNSDDEYFQSVCDEFTKEEEYSSKVPDLYKKPITEGEIAFWDKDDGIVNKESNKRNFFITFSELSVSFISGLLITKIKKQSEDEKRAKVLSLHITEAGESNE